MKQEKDIIYRVFDRKGKYQQSYSSKLPDSYQWAIDCASLINGKVNKSIINEKGETESETRVFPKKEE